MTAQSETEFRSVPETLVIVHAVEESGTTGQRLGTATLVDSEYALVSRPLNQQLLAERGRALRVGIFAVSRDRPGSEEQAAGSKTVAITGNRDGDSVWGSGAVIDVTGIRIVPDEPDLVMLELATAADTPALWPDPPTPEPSKDEVIAALHAVLDGRPFPIRPTEHPSSGGPVIMGRPTWQICKTLGICD